MAAKGGKKHIHGTEGAFVGGEWIPIEECEQVFNKPCGACTSKWGKPAPRSRTRHSSAKEDGSYDIVIIGAGCIGAAIARELAKTTASVLVLEGADDVTQGATKGNSGIVHAGYDDKPGSVRSKFCWPGNQMFPQLDRELHFGFERNGSLVVAKTDEDVAVLHELYERGQKNGVKNLRIIDQEELREREPMIADDCIAALHSPDAGTITPYEFTIALAENAADNGVEFRIRRVVKEIHQKEDGMYEVVAHHWEPSSPSTSALSKKSPYSQFPWQLVTLCGAAAALVAAFLPPASPWTGSYTTDLVASTFVAGLISSLAAILVIPSSSSSSSSSSSPSSSLASEKTASAHVSTFVPSPGTSLSGPFQEETIRAKYIINCAGCEADKVAAMVGDTSFKILPRYGEYILLDKKEGFRANHVMFPAPHPVLGKGVLVQTTLWGNLILGPTARDMYVKNAETGKYEPSSSVNDTPDTIMRYILSRVRNLVPSIKSEEVIHTFSGVRAKSTRGDWIIELCPTAKNFIHVAGIDSPGIAACPAIAQYVVHTLLADIGAPIQQSNSAFCPIRPPVIVPKKGWKGLKAGPVGKYTNPKENVVCKCEKVTEAEIVDAIRRSLPVDSTQAIRKRTRAGMGHCQGNPTNYDCEKRVASIIARELGVSVEEVGMRPWPASSMMYERWFGVEEKKHVASLAVAKEE